MKRKITTLLLLWGSLWMSAQNGFNYKALLTDNGTTLNNQSIDVRFTVLLNGTTNIYQEQQNTTTDDNGIFFLNIGEGTVISGDFDTIDWSSGDYFLKVEIDTGSGFEDFGTSGLKYVPFAKYADKAGNVFSGNFTDLNNIPNGLSDGDDDTHLTESQVDAYVANNGYLTSETDGSTTNELQTLSFDNSTRTLTISNGNSVTIPAGSASGGDGWGTQVVASDNTLTGDGTSVYPLGVDTGASAFDNWDKNASDDFSGNFADLNGIPAGLADGDDDTHLTESQVDAYVANNGYLTSETDGSTTNELQNLSISGNQLSISNGNTVTLPSGADDWGSQVVETGSSLTGDGTSANPLQVDTSASDFDNWDKDASDDFSGNYNDLTNKPVNFYKENTTDYSTDITETIYHSGNIILGSQSDSGSDLAKLTIISDSNPGGNKYGIKNKISGPGGIEYGIYNEMLNGSTYNKYGVYNKIISDATSIEIYGNYTTIETVSQAVGTANHISTSANMGQIGTVNEIEGNGNGNIVGSKNLIHGTGIGRHYGSYNYLYDDGIGRQYGVYNKIVNNQDGTQYGIYSEITGEGDGLHYGVSNLFQNGTGNQTGMENTFDLPDNNTSWLIGIDNEFTDNNSADKYGVKNKFLGDGSGENYGVLTRQINTGNASFTGIYNWATQETGDSYGIRNVISGEGKIYGVSNVLTPEGNENVYGEYIVISGDGGGTGDKYGIYSSITSSDSGEQYAIFAAATKNDDDVYAGYFVGKVKVLIGNLIVNTKLTSPVSGEDADMKAYIYGRIKSNADIDNGSSEGFTVTHTSTGKYKITFDQSIGSYNYIVTATAMDNTSPQIATVIKSTSYFYVNIWDTSGNRVDSSFDFVVFKK